MSANENPSENFNVNANNSNKTETTAITEIIGRTDDASDHDVMDDIEEINCSAEKESNQNQPDVYSPPGKGNSDYTEEMDTNDKTDSDKWVLPSPKKIQKASNSNESKEGCRMSEDTDLKVDLSPLNNDKVQDKASNKDIPSSDSSKPEESESSEIESPNSETNLELTVNLPPIDLVAKEGVEVNVPDKECTGKVKGNKGVPNDSEEKETPDSANEQSNSAMEEDTLEGVYQIKWVKFRGKEVPIITQNENGPCPLLAIMNVLLLKGKVKFSSDTEIISSEQMMAHLGECIFANKPENATEVVQLNYEQNMHDAMAVIHKLQTGLDVNVRFNGVSEFEYTPECIIFDLLGISLYHGWLVDPQNHSEVLAIGNCSYNQLVEKIISQRSSNNNDLITEALVAEGFLDRTASQLTYHGLCELSSTVKSDQLCVFFRNNHFCTLYRHKDELFLLVTDQGFLHERNVVWETLNNVEGDHYFVDSEFHTYTKPTPQEPVLPPEVPVNSDEQVNHDYLLAMSLQQEQQLSAEQMDIAEAANQHEGTRMSDAELAARLQAEENAQAAHHAAQHPAQHHGTPRIPPGGQHGQQRSRERERSGNRDRQRDRSKDKDSNCCIL